MSNIIEVHNLNHNYGDVQALCNVNLTIKKGEIFGLLGPNGAGKSTLIKSLVGALKPTSGKIKVNGYQLPDQRKIVQRFIGYMPQNPALYEDISVEENIRFFARAHFITNPEEKVAQVIKFTALQKKKDKPVRTLSGGMKQRVSLACALVHQPEILFLDEPTAGIDPQLRQTFWQYFHELSAKGVTIFITTHLMDEAEDCHRLGIMNKGQILKVDSVKKIMALGQEFISIKKNGEWKEITPNAGLAEALYPYGLSTDIEEIRIQHENLQQIILKLCKEGDSK
ncbi:hypothetical protein BBF96_15200 [Anoxybacter fermentans]|uniref:ABC transporter domain-containing protein n=1 Tax=Anoxybacter fermentans TaxID=1323375 RepID=A0A3Q9HT02_9FIRM|nr:ABC transporter ATP-binding protein [Anoxybacter fermentans]AZR74602.1 hypothetical protein BBF96_15200 [Anoxybacter fermentans]